MQEIDSTKYAKKYFTKPIDSKTLTIIKKDLKKVLATDGDVDETPIMENLEDYYGLDLSDFYGEEDRVDELFNMLSKRKGKPFSEV